MSGHHIVMPSTYFKILIALMVLMFLTIAAAELDIGLMADFVIAMLIATAKMLLVMSFFMHLKWSSSLVKIAGGIGFLFFIILIAFTFGDYIGREWHSPLGDRF